MIHLNSIAVCLLEIVDSAHAAGTQAVQKTPHVSPGPTLVLDSQIMNQIFTADLVPQLEKPTTDVKISKDEKGQIIIDGKGENGIVLDRNQLLADLNNGLNDDKKKIEIPVIEQKANVTISDDLQNLGIKNLIATGHTAFAGSHPGRIHNINTGIIKYNGLLVKQGEVFSFNDHLGPVDGEHGFLQELVIKGDQGTIPEYGGGLCQVSSTLFRAALYGGFPIVERAPHSYAVSYYAQIGGYGLDATIYPGSHDVKFLNDSPGDIVIQAYLDGDQAYFKFYGTDDGRKVWMEGPSESNRHSPGPAEIVQTDTLPEGTKKQIEASHVGFDVTWYRHLVKAGAEEVKETIFSRYKAIPAKVLVGGAAGSTGTTALTENAI